MGTKHHNWKKRDATPEYKEVAGTRLSSQRRRKVARLSEAQGHRCCYCHGETFLVQPRDPLPKGMSWDQQATLEHLIPKSKKVQTNKDENLLMACAKCNVLRGSYDYFEFYRSLRKTPKPIKVKKPKQLTAEQLSNVPAKESRCLALCLVVFAMYPEDAVYATENWEPRIPRSDFKPRAHQIQQMAKAVLADRRRIAA